MNANSVFSLMKNICLFKKAGDKRYTTTCWNLDELICYLDSTQSFIHDDKKFPVEAIGNCTADLDNNARVFESDDEQKMKEYHSNTCMDIQLSILILMVKL